jgi:5-deoxy-glucuronate isomerase
MEAGSMSYSASDLLIRPKVSGGAPSDILRLARNKPGFEHLSFSVQSLKKGGTFEGQTDQNELCIAMLGGTCSIRSSAGSWERVGKRLNVFAGMPYALYLPIKTEYSVSADTDCEMALCFSRAEESHPAQLITPEQVEVEVRGGGNATRQINHLIKPEFRAHRLLMVEVYTPSGNWSSYPPHKHDVHNPPEEVDLEEIYYYKIDRPEGYAIQRLYSANRGTDVALIVHDGELVLVPEGYHPVVAAHGYNVYYLNVLAGSARSMAATDDPDYAWVRGGWRDKDPRVALVRR